MSRQKNRELLQEINSYI